MKKININDYVKVKLTDSGKDIFYHQYDRVNEQYGKELLKPYYPEEDSDGFVEIQLWQLMQIYGPYMFNVIGCVPFKRNDIYFDDEVLVEV